MILSYWTLKRQSRSGIPLLRRLQSQNGQTTSKEANHFQDSSHLSVTVQNLRLGLERLRLLAELCLKREKLKKECVALKEDLFKSVVFPLQTLLLEALDGLNTLDVHSIFAKPVDSSVVIGYLDIIKQPMDLGTMRQKAANHKYHSIQEFEEDFSLMIANAKKFNSYGHFVHMEARRIGAKGKELLKLVKKSLSEVTFGENGVVVSLEKTVKNEIMGQQARGTQPTTKIPPLKRKRKFFQNSGGAGNLENFEEQVYENGLPLPSAHDPTIGEQKPKLIRNFSEKDTKKSALKVKKLPEFYQSAKKAEHDAAALLTHSLEKPQLSSDASPIITWESNNHPPIVDDEGRSIIYDCLKGQYMYGPRRSRRNCLRPSVEPVFQQEETPAYHESPLSLTSSNDTSPSLSVVNEKSALPSEEPQVSPDNLHSMEVITNESELACSISPKQNSAIVWAKQDTFPYYPAKIVKPPFRRIPQAVLKAEHEKSSCLVLYFDKRKTWGWIPEKKIRPLGRKEADLEMLSKLKGHWKKNVRIAYNKALKELEGNKT
ncbi:bromodomain and PHD finger-containing protein 3-like [Zophobas morio]|uniref:bromodomain and PHD finger-containing protein 3-like n=1 Tax=Zophobas morio TaxID=2755281 RepID=UPI0030827A58